MIEFEHTIFIILLLSGILNAKPPRQRWATLVILVGVLLVFLPPARQISIPWEIILGIVIPLLLWQNIRRIINSNWRGWGSTIFWGITVLIFSFALWLVGVLNWSGAFLFGIIIASMIWRAGEPEAGASYLSQMGTLTLIFLLTEAEAAIQSPNFYLGGVFSGAFIGVGTALFSVYLLRMISPQLHPWISIGQVYIAYWFSYFIGVSAVTAALISVMVFVWLNQNRQLAYRVKKLPAPLNSWTGFSFVLGLFLLLGWQAHQPVSTLLFIEVIAGTFLGLIITWLGRKWNIAAFHKEQAYWMAGARIALLLFPSLVLWPRDTLHNPAQLTVAIGIAIFVIGFSHVGLSYYFPQGAYSKNIS
ncbi:MAG: hypothetical protein H8E29_06245 [Anaerolineales bacterium]|uniref:Uncharacterized protein n=1 Tax=Candidatus Desulfolinea nitratireducens TaxID=2841698 RepID=A0A8J6THP3_9CHLR|nr:hypothetical protein [Candidatus Desulfolinea nitratireducens]